MGSIKTKIFEFVKKHQNIILLLIILALTLFWRLFEIKSLPGDLSVGEYNLVANGINIVKNHWQLPAQNITNALYLYLIAIIGKVTKFNIVYLRIFQAFIGFATVWFFYEFVRNWFNRQTAMLAALLFSVNAFHIALSREITPNILLPLIFIALFYLITNAFRTSKIGWFIGSGAVFGLSLYVSNLFFLVPIFFILSATYFYFRNHKIITAYSKQIIFGVIAFLIVSAPFLYFLPGNILNLLKSFNPGSVGHFYLNIGNAIQSIFYMTPINYLYNVGTEPLVDPFITVTFIAGFFYALFNLKRKKFMLLVGWLIALLGLIALQSTLDLSLLIILLPGIYILAAVMMDYVLTNWIRTFPFNILARLSITFVFSLFLFMSIFYNYQKYFFAFAKNENIRNMFKYHIELNH